MMYCWHSGPQHQSLSKRFGETGEMVNRGGNGDFIPSTAHLHGGSEGECSGHYGFFPPASSELFTNFQYNLHGKMFTGQKFF